MLHIEADGLLKPRQSVQRCELAYALMKLLQNAGEVDQVRLMADAWMHEGSRLEFENCAVMVSYHFHPWDWPDDGDLPMDEVVKRAAAPAEANGYVPMKQAGQDTKIYFMSELWADGVALTVLGEEGTFRAGIEAAKEGMNRRFAKTNIVMGLEDDRLWRVYEVEEQDHYEENGEDRPCFMVTLLPA